MRSSLGRHDAEQSLSTDVLVSLSTDVLVSLSTDVLVSRSEQIRSRFEAMAYLKKNYFSNTSGDVNLL